MEEVNNKMEVNKSGETETEKLKSDLSGAHIRFFFHSLFPIFFSTALDIVRVKWDI